MSGYYWYTIRQMKQRRESWHLNCKWRWDIMSKDIILWMKLFPFLYWWFPFCFEQISNCKEQRTEGCNNYLRILGRLPQLELNTTKTCWALSLIHLAYFKIYWEQCLRKKWIFTWLVQTHSNTMHLHETVMHDISQLKHFKL